MIKMPRTGVLAVGIYAFLFNDPVRMIICRLDAVFERYVPRATEIALERWRRRGLWHRLKDNAFYMLNEVL